MVLEFEGEVVSVQVVLVVDLLDSGADPEPCSTSNVLYIHHPSLMLTLGASTLHTQVLKAHSQSSPQPELPATDPRSGGDTDNLLRNADLDIATTSVILAERTNDIAGRTRTESQGLKEE
ncbi:hypothetical protein Tco_0264625 [Tanacetum coccineum]